MRRLRWPLFIAILALGAIALLLISQKPVLLPVEPVVEPATGGVYAEGLVGNLIRLNPLLDANNPADQDVDRLIFSALVRFDDHGIPHGDLADSWGVSRDGTVYNFSIRANALWHDGKPVTSDDVIFTIEMLRDPNSLLAEDIRALWDQVEVKRLDQKTLQFRLPEPFSPFMDYLTFGVLPAHLVGDLTFDELVNSSFNLSPIGSGPYRFDKLMTEGGEIVGVTLRSFSDYFLQPAFIDQFVFRYYPDAPSALAAYQNGDVLGIGQASQDILPQVLKEPDLNLYSGSISNLALILLNLDNPELPFFQQEEVRRALMLGMNRRRMVDQILHGQAIIADGPILPSSWAYYEGIEQIPYEPEQAISLLKDAGYTIPAEGGSVRTSSDGIPLAFTLLYPMDKADYKALAESIAAYWNRLGVGLTLEGVTYAELVERLDGRLYQAALVDLDMSDSPDPDPYPFWHQTQVTGGQNYSGWDDRQSSEYLEQARTTTDIAERTKLYHNFQVRFTQELPALPMFYPVYSYSVGNDVQGVTMGPLYTASDRLNTILSWFLVTRRAVAAGQDTPAIPAP